MKKKIVTLLAALGLIFVAAAISPPQADASGITAQTALAAKHSTVSDRRILTVATGLNGEGRRDFLSRGEWSTSRADGSSISTVSSFYRPGGCAAWVKVGVLPYVRWASERATGAWSNYSPVSATVVIKMVC